MAEFFISYTKSDQAWAEWIAFALEAHGHSCLIQAWDIRPGSNFVLEMQEAARKSKRTIIVLSPAYLRAAFPAPEWAAAFADDPQGLQRKLVPVRVEPCEPEGLLKSIVSIDLVGFDEAKANAALLRGVKAGRAKPDAAPAFPGVATSPASGPRFPGVPTIRPSETASTRAADDPRSRAGRLAQSEVRPELVRGMTNQTDAFLRSLYAASILATGGKLTAEQVNGLGETLQIAPAGTLDLVERLQSDGLVQLHWGGGLSLTTEGRQRAEGGDKATHSAPGGVSIGSIGAGASVNINSPEAVAGYQATGKGATGADAIRIEAPIGDLAAVLQALRSARAGLSGPAGEDAKALEGELDTMLKEVQRPEPNKEQLKETVGRSRSLLERLTQVGEITGKLKPILDLAGVAIGAVTKWLGTSPPLAV
jgi:hypothetical protein